ncbi:MAG: hypothetical protein U5Q44_11995 [Dehalococcoidia bacterium]|nr:hypothetical protein [Dehalococcoidia bacterium]
MRPSPFDADVTCPGPDDDDFYNGGSTGTVTGTNLARLSDGEGFQLDSNPVSISLDCTRSKLTLAKGRRGWTLRRIPLDVLEARLSGRPVPSEPGCSSGTGAGRAGYVDAGVDDLCR